MSANKIQLTKNDESVLFTFTDYKHYLTGNGRIEVPLNSLSLVIDSSDMVTFRKAASNDIFVSAPISDFGMSKAELEEWYAENMVGGTGGGIDPETLAELVSSAEYVSSSSTIDFKNVDGEVISTINAEPFITDGMVDNVQISGSNLVITFNVDAGKQPISIPLTDIFNPSNYYDKSATDTLLNAKLDASAMTDYYTSAQTNAAINEAVSGKADASAVPSVIVTGTSVYYTDGSHTNTEILVSKNNGTSTDIKFPRINGQYLAGNTNDIDVLPTSAFTAYSAATNTALNGKADTSAVTAIADSLSGKQDTLLFYSEEDNTQDGIKDAKIETTIEDSESGIVKTAYVESFVNDSSPYSEIYASTDVDNGEESYMKSADVYADSEDGVFINYHTHGNIEQTTYDAQININADGLSLSVDNGEDAASLNVTAEGVDIDGDPVVTESMLDDYATVASLSGKQDTLVAGSGITISGNVISADGGGGGMSEDDELLLATALVDLNDRKMDTADAKAEFAKYQRKGDYITSGQLDTKLAAYETALDEQNVEEVTSYALNDLNARLTTVETALGGLSLSAITQSQWATISGSANPSTIYIITNNE